MGDFVGPPQKSQFDDMSGEQRKRFDQALTIADGVKLYRSAGGIGVGAHWAPYAAELDKRGGLTEDQALTLARYRMWKDGLPVPTERMPAQTPEQINARREQFLSDPSSRSRLMDEDQQAIFNGHQDYFDSLVKKKKADEVKSRPPEAIAAPGVQYEPQMVPPQSIAAVPNEVS